MSVNRKLPEMLRQVLEASSNGSSPGQIAALLGVSHQTVALIQQYACEHFGCETYQQAVLKYAKGPAMDVSSNGQSVHQSEGRCG